ncbi:Lactonase, 7-bladed beta-propeller [Rubripirellula lacrimiformis]|uniref:Lactonase, 7-bladed beta-propeller n=1 Tax=Rubripirellula lacrimiformis TaxID=1930273 RepID=A0A517NH96_9BACT|nr:beta-propeller fold lactonase family protein [Rubripirellula lacrimiformis]QDT06505.1 Lactonase, 7-bladed beta-propeller [Rubripirellula lacrimiformis]
MTSRHLVLPVAIGLWVSTLIVAGGFSAVSAETTVGGTSAAPIGSPPQEMDRSPVDLAISPDGQWIVTINETSDSASLIRVADRTVVNEISIGQHPANLAFTPDGEFVLVTCAWAGTVQVLQISRDRLHLVRTIPVGMRPCGIAVSANSSKAYVGLVASGEVAEIDWQRGVVERRFHVGDWPRYLTLSNDASRLAVGLAGQSEIAVIDVASGENLYGEPLSGGINLGQMLTSADGTYAYFPWMVYRTNPINVRNIRLGWVLASRIGRVRLDGPAYREAVSLDVPGIAVADSHDLVISDDGKRIVASSSGTHELLVYRLPDLPFIAEGGPGDLIDPQLQYDPERFHRIEVGGRPMGMAIQRDPASGNQMVYVANYLANSVQVVEVVADDVAISSVVAEIPLGGPAKKTLARTGMEIFYDAKRSLDQWYSCHSCHPGGGSNSRVMDTFNDGTEMTFKTVLPLQNVTKTSPWTWHGWQDDLSDAMHRSIVSSMQGTAPESRDKEALVAFLETLDHPPNPYRLADGSLSESAMRGQDVFRSPKAACTDCHSGPLLTDGQIHDVDTGSKSDHYQGYNTPSLLGTYAKVRWLHHGRAKSLEDVVTDWHSPEKVNGTGPLSESEAADLVEYLKSL